MEVHRHLGPGLLESIYEDCLCDELSSAGMKYISQVEVPLVYKGKDLGRRFRMDLVVENVLVVEIKSLPQILPVHEAQLQSYLRLSRLAIGLLLNFNVAYLRDGIRRRSGQTG
jgi:GxxExxY protein